MENLVSTSKGGGIGVEPVLSEFPERPPHIFGGEQISNYLTL